MNGSNGVFGSGIEASGLVVKGNGTQSKRPSKFKNGLLNFHNEAGLNVGSNCSNIEPGELGLYSKGSTSG